MPVPNSTPIKFSKIREEGNKTSWVSPNYPTVGRQYNINPDWMIAVDENNQIGFNPTDGSFSVAQMPGWDTWKRPSFQFLKMHQYSATSGVRVAARVSAGDSVRAAYGIYRSQTRSDVAGGVSAALIAIIRYAGEYNPSAGLLNQYCELDLISGGGAAQDRRVKGVKPSYDWNDLAAHGDYDNTAPDAAAVYDPTSGATSPDFIISFVDTGAAGSLAGQTYYYSAQAIDGRQFHTLGAARADSVFSISNPTDVSTYTQAGITLFTADALGDTPAANNGINVFSGYNGLTVNNGAFFVQVEPTNLYYPYLSDELGEVWYAISTNTSAIEPPDGWTRAQGLPIQVDGLTPQTNYKFWLAPYTEGDGNSPTAAYETLQFQTEQAMHPKPTAPTGLVFTSKSSLVYDIEWCWSNDDGVAISGFSVQVINLDTSGSWHFSGNTNDPNARSMSVTAGDFSEAGDHFQFRLYAVSVAGELSDPSNVIDSVSSPTTSGATCP